MYVGAGEYVICVYVCKRSNSVPLVLDNAVIECLASLNFVVNIITLRACARVK